MGDKPDDLPIKYIFGESQRNQIAKFLDYNDLVEPIVKARGVDAAAILQQKMDFLTVAAAEAAIGLAILVCFFRVRGTIAVEDVNVMKG